MKKFLFFVCIVSGLSSCKILDPSIMLTTPPDYQFSEIPDSSGAEYKLAANDIIQFRLFSNDGFKIIDIINQQGGGAQLQSLNFSPSYIIKYGGTAKLPILGETKLSGLSLREAELYLEGLYSEFYNDPYVVITVSNRRVIVFPGQSGSATVISLTNDNTTLLEALALVGGLGNDAKASQIKVIRGESSDPEVYLIDLSTIDGMKDGGMVLQANDIIYVEPRVNTVKEILGEITPIVGLISTTISLITSAYSVYAITQLLKQP